MALLSDSYPARHVHRSEEEEGVHSTISAEATSLQAAPSAASASQDPSVHAATEAPRIHATPLVQPDAPEAPVRSSASAASSDTMRPGSDKEPQSIMKMLSTPFMMSNPLAEEEGETGVDAELTGAVHLAWACLWSRPSTVICITFAGCLGR